MLEYTRQRQTNVVEDLAGIDGDETALPSLRY